MESFNRNPVRAIRIHPLDNVATLLDDAVPGPVQIVGHEKMLVAALEPIAAGHKMAIAASSTGQSILKYGLSIGHAVRNIAAGEWVHLHNLASNYDQRSSTLDLQTGAPTDTSHAYR